MESLGVTMGPVFGSFALAFVACFATYAVTPRKWSADLRSRVFSTVNAILTFIVACQSAYRRKGQVWEGDLDLLTDNSDMSEKMVVAWVFGYFCADWFIGVYTNILDKATVLHHLIGIFSTSYCLYTDVGYAMCTLWLLNEASSPFVNMHHALVEFGIHDWRKAVNGSCMWLLFLLFRVIGNSVVVRMVYLMFSRPEAAAFIAAYPAGFASIVLGMPLILSINALWFYRITKGLMKVLGLTHSPKKAMEAVDDSIDAGLMGETAKTVPKSSPRRKQA